MIEQLRTQLTSNVLCCLEVTLIFFLPIPARGIRIRVQNSVLYGIHESIGTIRDLISIACRRDSQISTARYPGPV